jgi:rSAM/selenodomain-associated transferase 2/rSAM/selenodomain-associated transferase 1
MTRFPVPGSVKTRLATELGDDGAAELHRKLAAHCVARLRPLQATGEARVEVHVRGGGRTSIRRWLGTWPRIVPQSDGDLGDRLHTALQRALATGAPAAAVVGSDCPSARATDVRRALAALDTHDLVIGPAEDGGYWLLGVGAGVGPATLETLFDSIPWDGPDVLEATLERAESAGLTVAIAASRADVDRPEDIAHWRAEQALESSRPLTVSVIVPALDEEARVAAAVRSALDAGAAEVIVVDGGSSDKTCELASAEGARVLLAPRGRARQMNAGAAAAVGDALVFLHADTRLPSAAASRVCETFSVPDVVGGAFSWGTDDAAANALFNGVGSARQALFRVPYGDQAIFLRRSTFDDLGGYPDQPVMEDWELAQRLRRLGRTAVLPERALTSSRRWRHGGWIVPTASYLAMIAGYRLGMDPVTLDSWRRP